MALPDRHLDHSPIDSPSTGSASPHARRGCLLTSPDQPHGTLTWQWCPARSDCAVRPLADSNVRWNRPAALKVAGAGHRWRPVSGGGCL